MRTGANHRRTFRKQQNDTKDAKVVWVLYVRFVTILTTRANILKDYFSSLKDKHKMKKQQNQKN